MAQKQSASPKIQNDSISDTANVGKDFKLGSLFKVKCPCMSKFKFWFKRHRFLAVGLGVFALILLIFLTGIGITLIKASALKTNITGLQTHANAVLINVKNQNLPAAKAEVTATKDALDRLNHEYQSLSFWRLSPLYWHYQDGTKIIEAGYSGINAANLLINAVEPYADVLGLTGEAPVNQGSGTAEDRITTIIETIPLILPQLDAVEHELAAISQSLDAINPARYPFSLNGVKVQDTLIQAQTALHQADQALNAYRPVIEQLPHVAGATSPKTYLVLFQNDGELRATGGFITAFALLKVDKGKITPERSDDIYELDQKFRSRIEPPEPIKLYLDNVPYWNLRDMNLSPDFKVSMDTFTSHYITVPGEPEAIDGIITVDTQVLTHLIEVLGPVEVPGYGIFTAEIEPRCNCPQVVYALENMITRPTPYHRSDRKGVLGPLMQSILRKAYDAPSEQNPPLFQAIIDDVMQKHILFYFTNQDMQTAAETINVAGRIHQPEGDYFHINDTNFSGAKSNMFVSQEVEQEIEIVEGQVTKKVTVSYKNPQKADNCNLEAGQLCLNGVLRNWVRFYVPKGSQLVDSMGLDPESVKVSEDLDKTVIEGFFTLDPLSQAKVQLTYTIPYQPQGEYHLYIQKQPGSKLPEYTVILGANREEFVLETDKELVLKLQ